MLVLFSIVCICLKFVLFSYVLLLMVSVCWVKLWVCGIDVCGMWLVR